MPEMLQLKAKNFSQKLSLKTTNARLIRSIIKDQGGTGVPPQHLSAGLLKDERLTVTPLTARREVFMLLQPHLKSDPATT